MFEFSPLLILGFAGQGLFFLRFLIQWIHSEKRGESVIPVYFWYCSIGGAVLTFIYAMLRKDPVFILGQVLALVIYSRNIILLRRINGKRKGID